MRSGPGCGLARYAVWLGIQCGSAYSGAVTDPGPARITLITKPGCHLCGPARDVVERVARDLGVRWVELSILDDPELSAAYWEQIPVTLVDGVQNDFWRVDESRLRTALGSSRAIEVPDA